MLSRSGIANDLKVSPYKQEIVYSGVDSLTFVFSSRLYKKKFNERLEENRIKVNEMLSKRVGFEVQNNKLCDIKLYTTIEKRGFLIQDKERYECLSTIRLDGINLIQRN